MCKQCVKCGGVLLDNMLQDGYVCGVCGSEFPQWAGNRMEQSIEHIATRNDPEEDEDDLPAFFAT